MPSNSKTPSALQRFNVRPVSHSESSANGIDSGSVSMIVNGWRKLSNCAASTMYMKMDASRKAMIRLRVVSSRILTVPMKTD